MTSNTPSHTEKLFLAFLIIIALAQFSQWGYQTVKHLLGLVFGVEIANASFLDPIVGIVAIIGSILLFIGALFRWKGGVRSAHLLTTAFIFFIFKGIFDILNEIIKTRQQYENITEQTIDRLTTSIGEEAFQLVFWIVIALYFARKSRAKRNPSPQSTD